MADRFRSGDRVRHRPTGELGTVSHDFGGPRTVYVLFDDADFDEDGKPRDWPTAAEDLEHVMATSGGGF